MDNRKSFRRRCRMPSGAGSGIDAPPAALADKIDFPSVDQMQVYRVFQFQTALGREFPRAYVRRPVRGESGFDVPVQIFTGANGTELVELLVDVIYLSNMIDELLHNWNFIKHD